MLNSKTILVVDDDSIIRDFLVDFLRLEGYLVLQAENGEAALKLFSANNVDLIIADFNMPNMNGAELFWAIQNIRHTRYVLISGYFDPIQVSTVIDAGAEFVEKPFQLQDLLQVVERTYNEV